MLLAHVIGSVVSTRKQEALVGSKFLVVEDEYGKRFIAVDRVGAGLGEAVLVATGSAARVDRPDAPIDAAIVGIVDDGWE